MSNEEQYRAFLDRAKFMVWRFWAIGVFGILALPAFWLHFLTLPPFIPGLSVKGRFVWLTLWLTPMLALTFYYRLRTLSPSAIEQWIKLGTPYPRPEYIPIVWLSRKPTSEFGTPNSKPFSPYPNSEVISLMNVLPAEKASVLKAAWLQYANQRVCINAMWVSSLFALNEIHVPYQYYFWGLILAVQLFSFPRVAHINKLVENAARNFHSE